MNLSEAINNFTNQQTANNRSPLTIQVYRRDLKLLESFAGDIPIADLTPDLINRFVISDAVQLSFTGEQKSEVTIGRTKAALKSFGRFLADVGALSANPARGLEIRRSARKQPVFLSATEQKRLIKAVAARKGEAAERDLVILKLFLNTGIRLAELVGLDVPDVNLDGKKLSVTVKGDRQETRFLNTITRRSLRKYLRSRQHKPATSQALFLSNRQTRITHRQVQRRFEQWLAWSGINRPELTVHSLRHTFATNLYGRTNNLVLTSKALGHAQVNTTMIYTHLFDNQLEEALED